MVFILSRKSSKPNEVAAETGITESKRIVLSSSAKLIKFVFSCVTGLLVLISSKTGRRLPEGRTTAM